MYLYEVSTNYWYKILLLSRNEVFEHILQWCSTQLLVVNHKTGGTLLQVVKNGVFIESRSHSSPWNWKLTSLLFDKTRIQQCHVSGLMTSRVLHHCHLSHYLISGSYKQIVFQLFPFWCCPDIFLIGSLQDGRDKVEGEKSRYNKLEVYWTPPRACMNTYCYLEIE